MGNSEFAKQLWVVADLLEKVKVKIEPDIKLWNGLEYALPFFIKEQTNPSATHWRSQLITMAELLDGQDSSISDKQVKFLKGMLFGGMGSFNDVGFNHSGVYIQLQREREKLFLILESMEKP